jgi:hypothetical protein
MAALGMIEGIAAEPASAATLAALWKLDFKRIEGPTVLVISGHALKDGAAQPGAAQPSIQGGEESPVSRESILISLRDPYIWIEASANMICPPSSFSRRLPPTNRDRSQLCGSLRAELIPIRCDDWSANRKTGHERLVQPRVR